MESYITKCLNRLKKDLPRKLKDVRTTCDEVLGNNDSIASIFRIVLSEHLLAYLESGVSIDEQSIDEIAIVLNPLILSTQSRIPRVMETALDGINYMIGITFSLHSKTNPHNVFFQSMAIFQPLKKLERAA
jgi:hypothetical protein